MLERKELVKDDLKSMEFLGTIINNDDPEKLGRCTIRVFGKFDDLADDELPWAIPDLGLSFGKGGGGGAVSIPRKDTIVKVRFDNGNLYSPVFSSIQELSQDLLDEIKGSYLGSQSVIYDGDENLKIFYTRQKGLTLTLKDSRINIAPDNAITIEHKGTTSIIELRGNNITITADSEIDITGTSRVKIDSSEVWCNGKETKVGHVPSYSAVLAEPLWAFLKTLSAAVDAKLFPTPGAMSSAAATAEQLSTSQTVKISA